VPAAAVIAGRARLEGHGLATTRAAAGPQI
jgi:hypothetical protein